MHAWINTVPNCGQKQLHSLCKLAIETYALKCRLVLRIYVAFELTMNRCCLLTSESMKDNEPFVYTIQCLHGLPVVFRAALK